MTLNAMCRLLGISRDRAREWLAASPYLKPADLKGINEYPMWRWGDVCIELGVAPHLFGPEGQQEKRDREFKSLEREAVKSKEQQDREYLERTMRF